MKKNITEDTFDLVPKVTRGVEVGQILTLSIHETILGVKE